MLLMSSMGFAQTDLTLYNMNRTPQSMYQNPALSPPTKVNIGLPVLSSIYLQGINSGFAWKNLVQLGSDDSLTLNVDNMLDKLAAKNLLALNFNTDLLSFGFRSGKSYFSLNATTKSYMRFTYPKDFWSWHSG
jgi:hypothetical protein